ncbi:MAG: Rv0909 family putative TA system antitoxin [Acidimicrobiales bacterium]
MGLFDKLTKQAKTAAAAIDDLAEEHEEQIDDAIEKAAKLAKQKAGDSHDTKVDQAASGAHKLIDKLAKPD